MKLLNGPTTRRQQWLGFGLSPAVWTVYFVVVYVLNEAACGLPLLSPTAFFPAGHAVYRGDVGSDWPGGVVGLARLARGGWCGQRPFPGPHRFVVVWAVWGDDNGRVGRCPGVEAMLKPLRTFPWLLLALLLWGCHAAPC
jgi:hypothetical protein